MTLRIVSADFETDCFDGPYVYGDKESGYRVQTDITGGVLTGARNGHILEASFRLLDRDMNYLDDVSVLIRHPKSVWNDMNESVREFHSKCHEGKEYSFQERYFKFVYGTDTFVDQTEYPGIEIHEDENGNEEWVAESVECLEKAIIQMLKNDNPDLELYDMRSEDQLFLLGKSVRFDRNFMDAQMPIVSRMLNHQILDPSVLKLAGRLWGPAYEIQPRRSTHDAYEDCLAAEKDMEVLMTFYKSLPKVKYQKDAYRAVRNPLYRTWLWIKRHLIGV
ncbi:hypothetical protein [Vibrio phage BONAISHI]|nr:hypothetical protein [Vibrio phage BONAISHI]